MGATLAVVACLFHMLFCSLAGHAAPLSSLAPGWQDGEIGEISEISTDKASLYIEGNRTPSAIRRTDELDEVLVRRTFGSSSHRRSCRGMVCSRHYSLALPRVHHLRHIS